MTYQQSLNNQAGQRSNPVGAGTGSVEVEQGGGLLQHIKQGERE